MKVGDKVTYKDDGGFKKEFGIVKKVRNESQVAVVFNCANEWDNYMDYTGVVCQKRNLTLGWNE
ncbi:MAG: hypothetical protein AB8G11_16715 [Saprospiraceae bacterium]